MDWKVRNSHKIRKFLKFYHHSIDWYHILVIPHILWFLLANQEHSHWNLHIFCLVVYIHHHDCNYPHQSHNLNILEHFLVNFQFFNQKHTATFLSKLNFPLKWLPSSLFPFYLQYNKVFHLQVELHGIGNGSLSFLDLACLCNNFWLPLYLEQFLKKIVTILERSLLVLTTISYLIT